MVNNPAVAYNPDWWNKRARQRRPTTPRWTPAGTPDINALLTGIKTSPAPKPVRASDKLPHKAQVVLNRLAAKEWTLTKDPKGTGFRYVRQRDDLLGGKVKRGTCNVLFDRGLIKYDDQLYLVLA
jgi:hypothetical protein